MWQDMKLLNAITSTLVCLCVLALLAAGFWWLAQRPMFALKEIVVQGMENTELHRINVLTVKSAAQTRIKGTFFTANLDSVRAAFETVPWVRKVAVRREWPNKLIVSIEEHQPLGTWGEDGRLLSVKGDVFTANLAEAEVDSKLLEFDGPAGSEKEVLARYADLHEWFKPINLEPVSVQLSGRFSWSVKLNNGMKVKLGREQGKVRLRDLVARLTQVYPQILARLGNRIESADLRYPNGLALSAVGTSLVMDGKQKK
jgi:cell division protein FtsQ